MGAMPMKSRYRPVILIIIDIALIYLSYIFAFLIRFEWSYQTAF
jgi:hypothetical protein